MSKTTTAAVLTFSALSFAASVTTLAVLYVGVKKVEVEIEKVKKETDDITKKVKDAFAIFSK